MVVVKLVSLLSDKPGARLRHVATTYVWEKGSTEIGKRHNQSVGLATFTRVTLERGRSFLWKEGGSCALGHKLK